MSYEPTVWATGDVITSTKLNKLENGVAEASGGGGGALVCTVDWDTGALNKTWQEIKDACDAGTLVMLYDTGSVNYLTLVTFLLSDYRVSFISNEGVLLFKCSAANAYPIFIDE